MAAAAPCLTLANSSWNECAPPEWVLFMWVFYAPLLQASIQCRYSLPPSHHLCRGCRVYAPSLECIPEGLCRLRARYAHAQLITTAEYVSAIFRNTPHRKQSNQGSSLRNACRHSSPHPVSRIDAAESLIDIQAAGGLTVLGSKNRPHASKRRCRNWALESSYALRL